jgi:hypothetical protein
MILTPFQLWNYRFKANLSIIEHECNPLIVDSISNSSFSTEYKVNLTILLLIYNGHMTWDSLIWLIQLLILNSCNFNLSQSMLLLLHFPFWIISAVNVLLLILTFYEEYKCKIFNYSIMYATQTSSFSFFSLFIVFLTYHLPIEWFSIPKERISSRPNSVSISRSPFISLSHWNSKLLQIHLFSPPESLSSSSKNLLLFFNIKNHLQLLSKLYSLN